MLEERALTLSYLLARLLPLYLLLVWGSAAGQETTEYVGPHERDKDLTSVYGRYEIYEAVEYRGSIVTTAAEAQARVGQELIVTASLFRALGDRIENPIYEVWFYPSPPKGLVVDRSEWWSSVYLSGGGQPGGDEIIEVYQPDANGPLGPWLHLEIIGTNELWTRYDGWYYKARKTTRPVLSPGHADYCQVMGPCSAGQGDCDSDSECQSRLTCVDGRGASYGFAATVGVCEALTPSLQGAVEGVSRLNSGPLTLYGWAYNIAAATTSIPIEIYVGGAHGTGTLATTITTNQVRPDINTAQSITGTHGFAWAVPTQYQSSAQAFYVYALDQSPNPTVRTQLSPDSAPLTLRAVGTAAYCQHHGPCIVNQGDCTSNAECQSGLQCVANAGANHGFGATIGVCEGGGSWTFCSSTRRCRAGLGDCDGTGDSQCESGLYCAQNVGANYGYNPIVDVCQARAGEEDYCLTTQPCAAGQGDCDNDAECQSGLTCVEDAGARYGFAADVDVCEASTTPVTPETTTQTQSIYRLATSTPSTPSGGTSTEQHVPSGWSTSQPTPTTTEGVYESQRTVTYHDSVFQSATTWGVPTLVAQMQSIYRLATSPPTAPSGGTSTENHVPNGWSTTQPSATTTEGVYRSQRTVTYQGSVFQAATAWGTPTQVAAPTISVGHADYCRDFGPCSAGQGDCDGNSECQNGLRCVDNVGANYGFAAADTDVCEGAETRVRTLTAASQALQAPNPHAGDMFVDFDSQAQATRRFTLQGTTYQLNNVVVYDTNGRLEIASLMSRVGSSPPNYSLPAAVRQQLYIRAKFASPTLGRDVVIEAAYTDQRIFAAGYYSLYATGDTSSFLSQWRIGPDTDAVTIELFTQQTTQQPQSIYRRATTTPATPSGGTSTENHIPSGWSTSQPTATASQGVYRSQRTVTYRGGVFHSATAWGPPTQVAAPTISVGHANYCRDRGPCSAGQGDCDGNSECQSGLTCVNDVGANYGFSAVTDVCEVSETSVLTLTAASQALQAPNPHAGDMLVDFASRASSTRRFTLQGTTYQLNNVVVYDTNGRLEIASLMSRVGSSPPNYSLPAAVRQQLHIRAKFYSSSLRRNMVIEAAYTDQRIFAAGYYSLYATGDTSSFLSQWRIGPDTDNVTVELFTK